MDRRNFLTLAYKAARVAGLDVVTLGTVDGFPLELFLPQPKARGEAESPSVLVVSGFHGDEPAGPLGALRFMQRELPSWSSKVGVSLVPLVNSWGFYVGTHNDRQGFDPNRGYTGQDTPSSGCAKILYKNLGWLADLGRDGVLCLHEDPDQERFYLCPYEKTKTPGPFSKALRDSLGEHFPQAQDGPLYGEPDWNIKDGFIYLPAYGGLEERLFHDGCPATASTETPGKAPLTSRIKASLDLILALARFASKEEIIS